MKDFLIGLAKLCEEYDVSLRTATGIDFESIEGDCYIESDNIGERELLERAKLEDE